MSEICIKYINLLENYDGKNLNEKMLEYLWEKYLPVKRGRKTRFEEMTSISRDDGWDNLYNSYNERKMETYIKVCFGLGVTWEEAVAWICLCSFSLIGDSSITKAKLKTLELLKDKEFMKKEPLERVFEALDYYKNMKE